MAPSASASGLLERNGGLAGHRSARARTAGEPPLHLDPQGFAERFDREPFGFSHNLHTLDLFGFESLLELSRRFAAAPRDYFVAAAAASAAAEFTSVPQGQWSVEEAMRRIDS